MISVEQTVLHTEALYKRGLIITKDDVLDLTKGLLKNRGYYHRYTVSDKIYNFVNNNRKDLRILLVQFDDRRKVCNLHSGLCQKTESFKKLSMSEIVINSLLISCPYRLGDNEYIFNNHIFVEFKNDRVHAKAKLLFS